MLEHGTMDLRDIETPTLIGFSQLVYSDVVGSRHFLVKADSVTDYSANFIKSEPSMKANFLRYGQMTKLDLAEGDRFLGWQSPVSLERDLLTWVSHNTPPAVFSIGPAAVGRRTGAVIQRPDLSEQ